MSILRRKKSEKKEDENGAVRRYIRDLYRSDLDRHLWALPVAKNDKKRQKEREKRRRRAKRLFASAAGMLGAAGASYWLYRRIRKGKGEPDDQETTEADREPLDLPYEDGDES